MENTEIPNFKEASLLIMMNIIIAIENNDTELLQTSKKQINFLLRRAKKSKQILQELYNDIEKRKKQHHNPSEMGSE